MTLSFAPLGNRVIVRRHVADEKTPGGIVIPENAKDVVTRGDVVAVPLDLNAERREAVVVELSNLLSMLPADRHVDPYRIATSIGDAFAKRAPLDVGDVVIFGKYSGSDVTIDGEPYTILSSEDVRAASRPKKEEPADG